jgi:hypothetical protein
MVRGTPMVMSPFGGRVKSVATVSGDEITDELDWGAARPGGGRAVEGPVTM